MILDLKIFYSCGTGARIISVDEDHSHVYVTTTNGTLYTGDILVGADGVHSRVREEMWRLARCKAPGVFSDDEIDRATPKSYLFCRDHIADLDMFRYQM